MDSFVFAAKALWVFSSFLLFLHSLRLFASGFSSFFLLCLYSLRDTA